MKRAYLLTVLMIIMIGVCGCMTARKSITTEEIISLYNEKYDDEFTYVSSGNQLWNADYWEYILSSSKLGDVKVTVYVYKNGDMLDNYIPLKYKRFMEEKIAAIAEEIYGEVRVINLPMKYGNGSFTEKMTFEEYAGSPKSLICNAIIVNKSVEEKEIDAERLRMALEQERVFSKIYIYYYQECPVTEIEVIDEEFLKLSPDAETIGRLTLENNYSVKSLTWSE